MTKCSIDKLSIKNPSWIILLLQNVYGCPIDFVKDVVFPRVTDNDICEMLQLLPERDHTIIYHIYYERLTQKTTGVHMGVSPTRIGQILSRIVRNLRYKRWRGNLRYHFNIPDFYMLESLYEVREAYAELDRKDISTYRNLSFKIAEFYGEYDARFNMKCLITFRRICAKLIMNDKLGPYDIYHGDYYYIIIANKLMNIYEAEIFRSSSWLEGYGGAFSNARYRPRFMHHPKYIDDMTK